jgi:SAM-dependent methyltransferase
VAVAYADVVRHWREPQVRRWGRVIAGAKHGHFTLPSFAVVSSITEAADFQARGLLPAGAAVLDVGAGNGRQAIGLLELGVGRYVGLEVVRECVHFGNRAFRRWANVGFDWIDAANDMYNPTGAVDPTAAVFPYDDGEFDLVIAGSLFTHLQSAEVASRYLEEIARVLRPGGAAFTTWFRSPPNELATGALRSVFAERVIRDLVGASFTIEASTGGETNAVNDQWRLYLRRRPAESAPSPPRPASR